MSDDRYPSTDNEAWGRQLESYERAYEALAGEYAKLLRHVEAVMIERAEVADERDRLRADRERLAHMLVAAQTAATFFASVIKSGEPWSPECEEALAKALHVEPALDVSPAMGCRICDCPRFRPLPDDAEDCLCGHVDDEHDTRSTEGAPHEATGTGSDLLPMSTRSAVRGVGLLADPPPETPDTGKGDG